MPDYSHLCGFIPHPELAEQTREELHQAFGAAMALESGAGKEQRLYRFAREVMGKDFQEIQTIGDCVPHSYQRGWITLAGVRIKLKGLQEQIITAPATEAWYGWGRVNIARGAWSNGDGMSGSSAIQAAKQIGIVFRQKYGQYDLTTYSGSLARSWGKQGVPASLTQYASEHELLSYYPATTYELARDLIYNGYPVSVCSNWGFDNAVRDSQGFIKPKGSWSHCMLFTAVNDDPKRPGLLLDNRSWPNNWVAGAAPNDEPPGTGWVDADYCDKMLKGYWPGSGSYADSYAMSDIEGFVSQATDINQVEMF